MSRELVGNDGAFIEHDCVVFNYAKQLSEDTKMPAVVIPCVMDGEATLYVSGFESDDPASLAAAWHDSQEHRAHMALALVWRTKNEAHEINRDPAHPARKEMRGEQ